MPTTTKKNPVIGWVGLAALAGFALWYWQQYILPTLAENFPGYWGYVLGPKPKQGEQQTYLQVPVDWQLYEPNPGTLASMPTALKTLVPFVKNYDPPLDQYGWPKQLVPANFISSYQGKIYEPDTLLADQTISQNLLTPRGKGYGYPNAY